MRGAGVLIIAFAALAAALPAVGRSLVSPEEALRLAFPAATRMIMEAETG